MDPMGPDIAQVGEVGELSKWSENESTRLTFGLIPMLLKSLH
jgi:hypothetical protein